MNFKDYWDETHKKYSMGKISYDNWLDNYLDILNNCRTKILDLGSGVGNDSPYLVKNGFKVIACDFCTKLIRD